MNISQIVKYYTCKYYTCDQKSYTWKKFRSITRDTIHYIWHFAKVPKIWNTFTNNLKAYLILVSTASTGGGGLFSSRRTFFHREHGRYCFRKVYSENITHKIPYTPNKKLSTPTKKPSTPTKIPSRQTKRLSMINKTLIMPRKKQVRQQNIKYDNQNTKYANQNTKYANQKVRLFCREAIFLANLRTFWRTFFRPKKYGGVPKKTNMSYGVTPPFR